MDRQNDSCQSDRWVVLVSEGDGDDTVCQIVSLEYPTRQEAEDFAADLGLRQPDWDCIVDVCTVEEAEALVTD